MSTAISEVPRRNPSAEAPPTGQIAVTGKSVFRFAFPDQRFLYGTEGAGDNAILLNPDPVLDEEGAELGLGIYDADADGDANLSGLYETRAQAVIGLGWEVNAADSTPQAKAEAEFVRRALWGIKDFEDARRRMLVGSRRKGFSITEILWGGVDGYTTILELRDHDQRSFVFDAAWRPRIVLDPADLAGSKPIDGRKVIVMRHRAKAWNPYGVGIGQTIHYVATYKKHVLNFWAVYCEKHASPTIEAIYKSGAKQQAASILEIAKQASESDAIAHDEAIVLKALESARAGNPDAYRALLEYLDDEEAIAVLGQVLTSRAKPAGLGSGAADQQGDVRQDYLEYDAMTAADVLNELARMLVDANFGPRPANLYPKATIHAEARPDTASLADTIEKAMGVGMDIPREWAYTALGIPMPKPGEELLERPTPMVSAFGAPPVDPNADPNAVDPLATGKGSAGSAAGTNPSTQGEAAAA